MRKTILLTAAVLPFLGLFAGAARADEGEGAPRAPAAAAARVIRDIPYVATPGAGARLQSLDLAVPAGPGPFPVAVYVHGGGWSIGDKARVGEKAAAFTGAGFLFASINYRLSPAVRHPAHVEDVAAAIGWIHRNAARYGGDPGRLVLIGHSAGAHLVALVATDARRLDREGVPLAALRGVVPLDGAGYDIPRQVSEGGPLVRALFTAAFGRDLETQRDASPIRHVAPGKSIPPFLIVHAGERAASAAQAAALAGALREAGVDVEVYHARQKNHMSVNRDLGRPGDRLTERVLGFARRVTAAAESGPALR